MQHMSRYSAHKGKNTSRGKLGKTKEINQYTSRQIAEYLRAIIYTALCNKDETFPEDTETARIALIGVGSYSLSKLMVIEKYTLGYSRVSL